MDLRRGMRVEVCSSEDGYGGAWFEGVILTVTADGRRCKIRYDKFVTDDGKPLEEEALLHSEVRPIPPHIQLPLHCSVGDAVEAYDTDCWWRGFIVKLLTGAEEELWVVYFPDTRTLEAYPRSSLRPAQQWIRGNWIMVPQERSPIIEQEILSFTVDNSMEMPLKSGGQGVGKKRRQAVKCKAASLGGRASAKTKKLKVTVNTTVSRRQTAEGSDTNGA
uniref:Agenet domain-containing protein n=1 Tax=Picea sitchensis TaxID=3332 RepID=A9NQX5_PICSI|nr:unknown [Picea sitchensis]